MEVNVHHAKTHLSKLIAAAESGEEVIIARNGKPAVKLVVTVPQGRPSRRRVLGAGRGEIRVPGEREWSRMDKLVERRMKTAPLLSKGKR